MFKKVILLTLIAIINFASSLCNNYPNGTELISYWFNCPDSGVVVFNSLATVDEDGRHQYPIKLYKPIYINVNLDNNAKNFTDLTLDITLFRWGGTSKCGWYKIYTLGLLSRQNGCKNGVPCPINVGKNQNLRIMLDFTKFNFFMRYLPNNIPYQVMYKLTDESTGITSCTIVQALSLTRS
uniref:ML domain-containing protein n=1 Tax=Parastrongyloides trichosuri TaxID=131310 RepID=A0A0N4ZDD6_PARTI